MAKRPGKGDLNNNNFAVSTQTALCVLCILNRLNMRSTSTTDYKRNNNKNVITYILQKG